MSFHDGLPAPLLPSTRVPLRWWVNEGPTPPVQDLFSEGETFGWFIIPNRSLQVTAATNSKELFLKPVNVAEEAHPQCLLWI